MRSKKGRSETQIPVLVRLTNMGIFVIFYYKKKILSPVTLTTTFLIILKFNTGYITYAPAKILKATERWQKLNSKNDGIPKIRPNGKCKQFGPNQIQAPRTSLSKQYL